jgi:hypothetical protein
LSFSRLWNPHSDNRKETLRAFLWCHHHNLNLIHTSILASPPFFFLLFHFHSFLMLATPIHPSLSVSDTETPSGLESPPQKSVVHSIHLAGLSSPLPTGSLDHKLSPPCSDKRSRRRSLLPFFLSRLSSSPGRSSQKHSNASLHTTAASDPTVAADAGVSSTPVVPPAGEAPQISPIIQLSRSESVPSSSNRLSTYSVPANTPPARSKSINRATSLRRFSSTRSLKKLDYFPGIFTSTAAYRLSVPLTALHHLQSISERDISTKMHQTSSRLLRMTDDERPYTRVS